MGQNVIGVLLGARIPKGVKLYTDEGDGLLERWEKEARPRVKAYAEKHAVDTWIASRRIVPEWPQDVDVIGFWVMCEHGDEKGCPDIDGAIPLAGIEQTKAYRDALIAWRGWMVWVARQRVKFDEPALYLCPTEVA